MEYKDGQTYTFKLGECTARVTLHNFTPAVKERFSETLGRELYKAYSEREGLHDGRELAARAMA